MSVANTSQHLQVLESARLVVARRKGRFVVYYAAMIRATNLGLKES